MIGQTKTGFGARTLAGCARCVAVVVVCTASTVMAQVHGLASQSARLGEVFPASEFASQVNDTFNLMASSVITLTVEGTPGGLATAVVPINGQPYTLKMTPKSVRADSYEVRVQQPDGSFVIAEPGPVRTYQGTIEEVPHSRVVASWFEEGLYATLYFPDGVKYWIEPIAPRMPGVTADQHVLYLGADVMSSGRKCGLEHRAGGNDDGDQTAGGIPPDTTPGVWVTELACDADFEYFLAWGSVNGVQNRINAVVNGLNGQYEDEVQITHLITTILVRTSEPDPYSATASHDLLVQFRNEWLNNQQGIQRDVAKLFTGKNINGGIIGEAWTFGGICNTSGYCYSQNDCCCCPSFACSTDLAAHELGHLWNADHVQNTSYTMNNFLTCVNQFHPTQTQPQIVAYRNTRTCIEEWDPPIEIVIEGPTVVPEDETAEYSATTFYTLGVSHDVGPFAEWSVTPPFVGTIDGGLFTPNDVVGDTAAVIHVEWTEIGVTVTDDFPITVTDETPLTTAVVVVDLVPSVPPEGLSPGQQFTVDVLISAVNEEILDLRQIQFDSRLSTGVTVDAVTFDFEGIDEDFLYLLDESTDVFSAIYIGLQPIPGTIIHLDETPERVAVLDVTFTADGTLNIFGESEPFTVDESVRFQAGFELILEFSQILENVEGGLLDLAEGDVPLGIVSSDPEDGAIDARQPFAPDGSNPDGWSGIELTFNGDATPIGTGDFAITSDPPGAAPDVESVTPSGSDLILEFTEIIPVEAWTIVTHTPSNTSVRIGYLPADVNNDKLSNASDVLTLIDNLNGVVGPFPPYQTDTDRSGATNANDVLRVIDLLNGAGSYPEFLGATLPD